MSDVPKKSGELFYTDEDGERHDEGLHDLEPEDPVRYARAGAANALKIGLSRETVVSTYGEEAVLQAEAKLRDQAG